MALNHDQFGGFRLSPVKGNGPFKVLVLDGGARAHHLLTRLLAHLAAKYADSTARAYLYALLRYFVWLEANHLAWNAAPDEVRTQCYGYLATELNCHLRDHRLGFVVVKQTDLNATQIKQLLAALHQLYRFAYKQGLYAYEDPLATVPLDDEADDLADAPLEEDYSPPRMPAISGVVAQTADRTRLTNQYFVLSEAAWQPAIIDDPLLPNYVFRAGRAAHWQLREEIVTRLLFETGARVGETCGLMVSDWFRLGAKTEAETFNKGSYGLRTKTIHFSESTAKLLRRYFNSSRRSLDPRAWGFADYENHSQETPLLEVPLFLTRQHTQLLPSTFRDLYWRPACRAAGLVVNIHQARHWYVTQAIREIHETTPAGAERQRREQELIAYMAWKFGEVTLRSYNHYFDKLGHHATQDAVHAKLDAALRRRLREDQPPTTILTTVRSPVRPIELPVDDDWDFLINGGTDK